MSTQLLSITEANFNNDSKDFFKAHFPQFAYSIMSLKSAKYKKHVSSLLSMWYIVHSWNLYDASWWEKKQWGKKKSDAGSDNKRNRGFILGAPCVAWPMSTLSRVKFPLPLNILSFSSKRSCCTDSNLSVGLRFWLPGISELCSGMLHCCTDLLSNTVYLPGTVTTQWTRTQKARQSIKLPYIFF